MTNTARHLQCALLACAALALALAAPATARSRNPLYQWTDAAGAVRYTSRIERIPAEQRSAAVLVAAAPGTAHAGDPSTAGQPAAAKPTAAQPAAEPAAPPDSAPSPAVAALDARIAELEQRIAADETALGDYISDPERAKRPPESGKEDVAAIADRLPRLQNELRELRAQRAAAAGAPAVLPSAP